MVGGVALRYALGHSDVEQVVAIGRTRLDVVHSKLLHVPHADFSDCSALAESLEGKDGAVFCLGTYTGGSLPCACCGPHTYTRCSGAQSHTSATACCAVPIRSCG
jgi:hypothetical protein